MILTARSLRSLSLLLPILLAVGCDEDSNSTSSNKSASAVPNDPIGGEIEGNPRSASTTTMALSLTSNAKIPPTIQKIVRKTMATAMTAATTKARDDGNGGGDSRGDDGGDDAPVPETRHECFCSAVVLQR